MERPEASVDENTTGYNEGLYGVSDHPNIDNIVFGNYEFKAWFGNTAYFDQNKSQSQLGYEVVNLEMSLDVKKRSCIQLKRIEKTNIWLENLYVCPYCFKYTDKYNYYCQHQSACELNTDHPLIGRLLYRDDHSGRIIKQIRGFKHLLFCQNLCLFSKLFLNDKSVYYNVDLFDFYILYGTDSELKENPAPGKYIPMGFFSKDILSWDLDNNLACICIFPPFQKRHLGSLLIEFSYILAGETPGQLVSGPELPLSAYGRISYLKFWSQKLAFVIHSRLKTKKLFNLLMLAEITGFRKEDILITLEYMGVLIHVNKNEVALMLGNLTSWCKKNKVDLQQEKHYLIMDNLII